LPTYLALAGQLQAQMDGWTFQLSPRAWRPWSGQTENDPDSVLGGAANSPTVMLAKFCNRALSDLVADSSSWVWPEVAVPPVDGGTIGQTQRLILDIFADAAATEAGSPYRRFLDEVVDNPAWNGFLFLNAPVDIAEMPDDLLFLTAGIDTGRFYAHHLGLSQTPFVVTGTKPVLQNTATFGLIDYNDPVDLYSEDTVPIDFKTLQRRASCSNSALSACPSRPELLVHRAERRLGQGRAAGDPALLRRPDQVAGRARQQPGARRRLPACRHSPGLQLRAHRAQQLRHARFGPVAYRRCLRRPADSGRPRQRPARERFHSVWHAAVRRSAGLRLVLVRARAGRGECADRRCQRPSL